MKKVTLLVFCLAFVSSAFAGDFHKDKVCSLRTLRGAYAFAERGEVFRARDVFKDDAFISDAESDAQAAIDDTPDVTTDSFKHRERPTPLLLHGIALVTFDGHGGLTQKDDVELEGRFVSRFDTSGSTGSYKVNGDCTGQLSISFADRRFPITVDFVISDDGNGLYAVLTTCNGKQGVAAVEAVARKIDIDDDDDKWSRRW